MKPQLISFKLCPFVQRSVITLLEKGVDFDITYVDLSNPPDWFKAVSPTGKVPVLKVGDTVLFESAVIMEYLDEVNPPSLHPADPLRKAQNRAWIEFGSDLLFCQYNMINAAEKEGFEQKRSELKAKLAQLDEVVAGPLFNGDGFSLADAAFAPLLMRANLLEQWHPLGLFEKVPKIRVWKDHLLERESIRQSVVRDFDDLFRGHVCGCGSYAAGLFTA